MPVNGTTKPTVSFDVALLAADMARKGWNNSALAARARVSGMAVGRFLSGQVQTAPMAKRLAKALGHDVSRYVVAPSRPAVAS
jgi:plasmid maintenance system antidote protein VapI